MVKSTKSAEQRQFQLKQFAQEVFFLRYGHNNYQDREQPLLPVSFVARLMKVKTERCFYALGRLSRLVPQVSQLEADHDSKSKAASLVTLENITESELRCLTSTQSLADSAELSLQQRVALFNKKHPDRKLRVSRLRQIFRQHGIKKKVIKRRLRSAKSQVELDQEANRFFSHFRQAEAKRHEIIMIDECIFSQKSYQDRAWTRTRENIVISKRFKNTSCVAVVAAISDRRGLISYLVKRKSIKKDDFAQLIRKVRAKCGRRKQYTLLLDNCSVHKTEVSREAMRHLDVIFNIAYSPWYNGIELYWAQAKQYFRRELLRAMLDQEELDMENMVIDALLAVDRERVKDCALSALKLIRNDAKKLL